MTEQITPLETQKVLDLCSGIGGFTLGHKICGGFETVAFCEINEYCQQVLSLRFPQIPIIPDIYDITTESLARIGVAKIDGIIAGLPCPPFSLAGKRLASLDSRNLFGEFFRVLRCVRPHWAIVENVPGLLTAESGSFFRGVLWEFASLGFDVEWGVLSAAEVGAVHLRERIWIIATYSHCPRRYTSWSQYEKEGTNAASVGGGDDDDFQRLSHYSVKFPAIALCKFRGGNDGLPTRLDRCLLGVTGITDWLAAATVPSFSRLTRREVAALTLSCQKEYRQLWAEYQAIRKQHKQQLMALGNAIVPQCAALIFGRLKTILSQKKLMIDNVNALKTSWYLSPPWDKIIPPVEVNLLERVYLRTTKTFGYCCGIQWKHECWLYSINYRNEIVHATQHQIIGTGELVTLPVPKPTFVLGQKVILTSYSNDAKQRLILGIGLLDNSWFYVVELVSPTLTKTPTIFNRFSLVGEKSLVRVNA